MQSTEITEALKELKLFGMLSLYRDIETDSIRNKHTFVQFLQALCCREKEERKVRSIRYQMGIAKFPVSKGIDTFMFNDTPINELLVRTLYRGGFLQQHRNIVQSWRFENRT